MCVCVYAGHSGMACVTGGRKGSRSLCVCGGGVTLAGQLEVLGMPHALLELINAVGHCMHYSSLQNAFTPNM